jgi:RsiW-degrading membrane proteinase PrsW (M82 family)
MGPSLLLIVVLALFALLTAGLVYRHDLYEHEPLPLLGVAVALGAGTMWLAGRVEELALVRLTSADPVAIAAVAAATEELLKLLVVVVVALLARREFDDPMDGVVYGSMGGLGMALEESVHYLGQPSVTDPFAAGELVRLWAHVVLGGIVGFPLGFFRSRPAWAAGVGLLGLGVTTGLHFAWDAVVLALPAGAIPGSAQAALGIGVMSASLLLYGWLVTRASEQSRRELAPGSPLRLWGWPFVASPRTRVEQRVPPFRRGPE